MLRALVRLSGLLALAGAFVLGVLDGVAWVGSGGFAPQGLWPLLAGLAPDPGETGRALLATVPAFAALGALGIALLWVGGRRERPVGTLTGR